MDQNQTNQETNRQYTNEQNANGQYQNGPYQNGPYQNGGYKQLRKSRNNRVICGVCGGLGEYLNVDPTVVRILTVVLGCCGAGLVAYIVAAICMPE